MHEGFKILAGQQVDLRRFTAADITANYMGWLHDAEALRYSNQRFRSHTRESCQAYLDSFTGTPNLFLAIELRADHRVIGTMTAYVATPHGTADMGILVGDRSVWGRGIGLDAWQTLLGYLLGTVRLRKITGGTLRCNRAMVRIMERSGMGLEAVRSQQEIVDGKPEDALYYARFRAE